MGTETACPYRKLRYEGVIGQTEGCPWAWSGLVLTMALPWFPEGPMVAWVLAASLEMAIPAALGAVIGYHSWLPPLP